MKTNQQMDYQTALRIVARSVADDHTPSQNLGRAEAAVSLLAMLLRNNWTDITEALEINPERKIAVSLGLGFDESEKPSVKARISYGIRHTEDVQMSVPAPAQLTLPVESEAQHD